MELSSPTPILACCNLLSIVSADFNRDGTLDLAVGEIDSLSVLLGKGDGTFERPVSYSAESILLPSLSVTSIPTANWT